MSGWTAGQVRFKDDPKSPVSDACCGNEVASGSPPSRLRDVREIRSAAIAGGALAVGSAAAASGGQLLSSVGFVSVAEALESFALARARQVLRALLDLVPAGAEGV